MYARARKRASGKPTRRCALRFPRSSTHTPEESYLRGGQLWERCYRERSLWREALTLSLVHGDSPGQRSLLDKVPLGDRAAPSRAGPKP
jgi:hypothetical protein